MLAHCKNGVSSWEIHRVIGITQKVRMAHDAKIQAGLYNGTIFNIRGTRKIPVDDGDRALLASCCALCLDLAPGALGSVRSRLAALFLRHVGGSIPPRRSSRRCCRSWP